MNQEAILVLAIISLFGIVHATHQRQLLDVSIMYGNQDGGSPMVMYPIDESLRISRICTRSGTSLDQLETIWNDGQAAVCGGNEGSLNGCFEIAENDCITSIDIQSGGLIDGIRFHTKNGHSSPYYGGPGGLSHSITGNDGSCLKAMNGRCGRYVDGLQFVFENPGEKLSEMECYEDEFYVNDIDGAFNNVKSSYFLNGVNSIHYNHEDDRRFKWRYCKPPGLSSFSGESVRPATGLDEEWDRGCYDLNGGQAGIRGIDSFHDDHTEDRVFTIHCGGLDVEKHRLGDCFWSTRLNNLDEDLNYFCPQDGIIRSIWSQHNNHNEDRIFKFECCTVTDMTHEFGNKLGAWTQLRSCTGCPSHEYRETEGVSSTITTSITNSYTNSLSRSISQGFSFKFDHFESSTTFTMETTASSTVSRQMTESFTTSSTEVHITICDKIYLYQWEISGTDSRSDGSSGTFTVKSNDYLCTNTANPKCPIGYCHDSDCQTCNDACYITAACDVVLHFGFRTDVQNMADDDCRNVIIVELSYLCNNDDLQGFSTPELVGKIFNAENLLTMGKASESELKTMNTDDHRNKMIVATNECAPEYSIGTLQGKSDQEISCIADTKAC